MYTKSNRLLCAALTGMMFFSPVAPYANAAEAPKTVTVIDDGILTRSGTEAKSIKQLLEEQNITLGKGDIISHLSNVSVSNNMVVKIDRAKNYIIPTGRGDIVLNTAEEIDKDLLKGHGIHVDDDDYITQTFDITRNSYIVTVTDVAVREITEKETLENSTIEIKTDELYEGQKVIETEGTIGSVSKNYLVRYEDGKEVSRVLTSETVTQKPVDRVMKVGTKKRAVTGISPSYSPAIIDSSSGTITTCDGKVLKYSKAMSMRASAYDLSYESCGKNPGDRGYGITASGIKARYGVIAVDPSVIPLGTKLYIECPNGGWVYGEAIAGDTGGAIKGDRIDLFYNSKQEALNFGRRTAMVYVLAE